MGIVSWNNDANYLEGSFTDKPRLAALTSGVIMSVWMRNPTRDNAPCAIILDSAVANNNLQVRRLNSGTFWGVNRAANGFVAMPYTLTINTTHWYHCIFRAGVLGSGADGSQLYVDGVANSAVQAAAAFDTSSNFNRIRFGRAGAAGVPFGGDIAECAIWWNTSGLPSVATLANNLGVLMQSPMDQTVQPSNYYRFISTTADIGTAPTTLNLIGGVAPTYTAGPAVLNPGTTLPPPPPDRTAFFLIV